MTTIRPYDPGDLQACRDLWVELTVHHRRIYGTDTIGGDDPGAQFDEHLTAVGPERIWVAERDGTVVGLVGLIVDGTSGEVEPVVVAEDERGRGIGRGLLKRVTAEAGALGIRLLSVRPVGRNTAALRFFRDSGFDVLGHIEAFMDLEGDREWVDGETIAGRNFKV
ncbi:MAG: GNAT family N-acetyltransferase [Acidimicrobiia bacterium]